MSLFTVTRQRSRNSFFSQLAQRKKELGSVTSISASIVVPDSMKWWIWQEFGTATRGDPGHASGQSYEILPVKGKALRWPNATSPTEEDGSRIQPFVEAHPGIPSHHFVTKSLQDILQTAHKHFSEALHQGKVWSLEAVKNALITRTMPAAIHRISIEMMREIPDARPDGRLDGLHAYEVWERDAKVVDTSR
jgi:hypothetical protein